MQVPYSVLPASAATDPATGAPAVPVSSLVMGAAPLTPQQGSGSVVQVIQQLQCRFQPDVGGTLVRRLLIAGPASSAAAVYIGPVPTGTDPGALQPAYQVDLTARGAGDLASYDPPLFVPVNQVLIVAWNVTASSAILAANAGRTYARLERA